MKKLIIPIIILIIIFIIVCIIIFNNKQVSQGIEPVMDLDEKYVKNQILVTFKEETSTKKMKKILSQTKASYENSDDNFYILTFATEFNTKQELEEYCTKFQKDHPEVSTCEANEIIILDDCNEGPC